MSKQQNNSKKMIVSASKKAKIVSQLLVKNELDKSGRLLLENHKIGAGEKVLFRHSVIIPAKEVNVIKAIWQKKGGTNEQKYKATKQLLKKYVRSNALCLDSESVGLGIANHTRERQLCYNPVLSAINVEYRKEYGKKN